jgi:hypothetical protein
MNRDVGDALLAELRRILPDGRTGALGYEGTILVDDPRFHELQDRLRQAGLKPKTARDREQDRNSEYRLLLWREYDPSDFNACHFVEFTGFVRSKVQDNQPDGWYKLVSTGKDGVLEINEAEFDPKHSFLRSGTRIVCSDRAKRALEKRRSLDWHSSPRGCGIASVRVLKTKITSLAM